jgi:fructokinase
LQSSYLVVGESLTDVITFARGSRDFPGGSPLNVAVGLARLGEKATLHTQFGRDRRGQAIKDHLTKSGVHVTPESTSSTPTSVAIAHIDEAGAATYSFELSAELPLLSPVPSVDHVHSGSIGAVLEPGATQVRAIFDVARPHSTISYDPNIRPALMGQPQDAVGRVEALVDRSDVVKASDEDLRWLYPGVDTGEVAAAWARRGPCLVVVTRGGRGADAFTASTSVRIAPPIVNVVDTVGAGDSFMAGLLAALGDRQLLGAKNRAAIAALDQGTLKDIVSFAAQCAAVTVTRPGANPPSRQELTLTSIA